MFRTVVGVRNLKAIIAEASSARVLNLVSLSMNPPAEEGYFERPLFQHPVLNRTIIVKHNVPSTEKDPMAPRRMGATKVIFPFDPADLDMGGQYLFVDQPDFIAALTRHIDSRGPSLDRDVRVLRLLDKLPTLDPFLIRGILTHQKIDVSRCYHRLTDHDRADMLSFVNGQMQALIQLCFDAPTKDDARAKRLAERLLGDGDSPELEVLREALRLSPEEFSEAMFTWKAFLYYRWRARELMPQLKATLQAFSRIRARRFEPDELSFIMRCHDLLQRTVVGLMDEVNQRLKRYDEAFEALTGVGDPGSFRMFLARGAGLDLGTRIGGLEQLVGFWGQRFGQQPIAAMSPDDIIDGLRDLLQGLSISPLSEPAPPQEAEPETRAAVA